jgi:hypothetical protein
MPPLTDPVILNSFRAVLAEWRCTGYTTATDRMLEWIANNLGPLTLRDVAREMHAFLNAGGVIDQQPERRPEWNMWPFHYDFRLRIGSRLVYIETILQDDDPNDPTVHIVSIHDV